MTATSTTTSSPPRFFLGEGFYNGAKDTYEDFYIHQSFRENGITLSVMIVADGAGGAELGQRAARVGVETTIAFVKQNWFSSHKNIPQLLTRAGETAQRAVLDERARKLQQGQLKPGGKMYTTLTVAAILSQRKAGEPAHQLFVANAGDSQVYVYREGKLALFTRDHSDPSDGALVNCLGIDQGFFVDIGIYHNTNEDLDLAREYGENGFDLEPGDAVLVCSDGLTKVDPQYGRAPVTREKISRVLRSNYGNKAAQALIGLASGSDAYDNVTVLVSQLPEKTWKRQLRALTPLLLLLVIGAFAMVFFVLLLQQLGRNSDLIAEQQETNVAFVGTQTADAYTDTPTITPTPTLTLVPVPTLAPLEIGYAYDLFSGSQRNFTVDQRIDSGANFMVLNLPNPQRVDSIARLHLSPSTSLFFTSASDDRLRLTLFEGGNLFLQTGGFGRGALITLRQVPNIQFSVTGSCIAVYYTSDPAQGQVSASCYEGSCGYSTEIGGATTNIPEGSTLSINTTTVAANAMSAITETEASSYLTNLQRSAEGNQDANICRVNRFIPTPTPTPTLTPTRRPPTSTTLPPTDVPPTGVPPTAVPPTDVPPTAVPPTAVPPTAVPPTAVPPTAVPPTVVPPTAVPPTAVPPTAVPPTAVPPTAVPPTDVPPTAVPPTDLPPEVTQSQ